MPVASSLRLYAGTDYTSAADFVVADAPGDSSIYERFQLTASRSQGDAWPVATKWTGIELTDDFAAKDDGAEALSLISRGTLTGRTYMYVDGTPPGWTSTKAGSGAVGVGMVIDKGPVNSAGEYAPDAVVDGTKVNMSFVVSLSTD